ncbi:MAG: hypothetical protein ABIJ86_14160 [Spirochaetota bacterium]
MGTDMGFIDKVLFSFRVMARWEVLATLAGFIAVWLLMRYIADPWSRTTRPTKIRKKEGPPAMADDSGHPDGEDFPD